MRTQEIALVLIIKKLWGFSVALCFGQQSPLHKIPQNLLIMAKSEKTPQNFQNLSNCYQFKNLRKDTLLYSRYLPLN